MRKLLPLLLFCGFAISARAQTTSGISGIITERGSGEVVIGGAVLLYRDSTITAHPFRGAITNKFGFYSLAKVPEGSYTMVAHCIGFRNVTKRIVIVDSSIRLDFVLASEKLNQEVVVEGAKNASPTRSISSIDIRPELLMHMPALGGETDIFRALQMLPGVKASSEISSGLYVRGGSPDQNLTLLDGVIVYNPSHLAGFMSTFNADAIQDLRLIKGAFPAEYGGRLSSVLDLTMKEGSKDGIHGAAGISMINSRALVEGPINDNSTFMFSGRRMYLDLLFKLAPAEYTNGAPDYYFYDFNGKINYKLGEKDRLYLSGYFGRDVFTLPSGSDSQLVDIHWGNSTANLRWSHILSTDLFLNSSLIYTNYGFSSDIEDQHTPTAQNPYTNSFKSISGIQDYMLRSEVQYYPDQDHTLKFGIEATEHRFRADATDSIANFAAIDRNPTILNSFDGSFYAQDEWKITPLLSSNIGARIYYFQDGGYFRAEPRLSFAYDLLENLQLTAAFSEGNQFLHLITRNDLALPTDVWFPSTPNIKPEHALQGVLGVQTHLFNDEYLCSVESYYKSMKNLYEYKDTASFSLDVPLESSFTSGSGEAYGLELFLNKQIGSFTGWIGYTLSWTSRTFPELNGGKPFSPRYDERHDIQLVLTYKLGDSWEFGASWIYATGQAYTLPTGQLSFSPDPAASSPFNETRLEYTERNGYHLPPFHKLDLNFTHSFSWFKLPWKVSINIYNAYNRKNVFSESVVQSSTAGQDLATTGPYMLRKITLFPFIPTFGLSMTF